MSNNKIYSANEIFAREDISDSDFLFIAESLYIFLSRSTDNILNGFNSISIFFDKTVTVLQWIALLPLRIFLIAVSLIVYFTLAPSIRIYMLYKANKLKESNLLLEQRIKSAKVSKTTLQKQHKTIKEGLDILVKKTELLNRELIMKPSIDKFNQELKKRELILRLNAYPEINEKVFSYDELRELSLVDLSF